MNLSCFGYTKEESNKILQSMIMLIDTREKVNQHITEWLKNKGIPFKNQFLDYGDYSFMIPAIPELGINREIYFDKQVTIERKASLEELSQNLAQERQRFENEWLRAKDTKKILLIERGSYEEILEGRFGTNFNASAYFGSLLTFQHRYGLNISFIGKEHSAKFIYMQFYYFLRQVLGG